MPRKNYKVRREGRFSQKSEDITLVFSFWVTNGLTSKVCPKSNDTVVYGSMVRKVQKGRKKVSYFSHFLRKSRPYMSERKTSWPNSFFSFSWPRIRIQNEMCFFTLVFSAFRILPGILRKKIETNCKFLSPGILEKTQKPRKNTKNVIFLACFSRSPRYLEKTLKNWITPVCSIFREFSTFWSRHLQFFPDSVL